MKTKILHPKKNQVSRYFQEPQYQLTENNEEVELIISGSSTDLSKEQLQKYLQLNNIINCCNGINNVDQEYCKQNNITIFNAPTANINATAEHAITLILTALRKITQADRSMRQGYWKRELFMGREINECNIGFIGFGRIARLVNEKITSFKPKQILAYDPFLSQEQMGAAATKVELKQLIKEADIISLHLPLLDSTRNMISTDQFKLFKPETIILNCSRGGIIDETALIEFLKNNNGAAAALDVFENEPEIKPQLLELPNITLTPHLGSMSKKAQERMITEAKERFEESIDNVKLRQ